MPSTLANRPRHALSSLAARLYRDTRGIAAVEFALVLPLLVIMLLGTIEIARAIDADRRFGNATAMTTDLIAREQDITDADLDGMMNAIQHLMHPYDSDSLKLGVIAVRSPITPGEQPVVEWSYSHQGKDVPARCANYTLPEGLISPGSRVVVVETEYGFRPLFVNWADNPFKDTGSGGLVNWRDKSTFTPRSDCVHNSDHENSSSRCDFACP